jgi:hypothetical protein
LILLHLVCALQVVVHSSNLTLMGWKLSFCQPKIID